MHRVYTITIVSYLGPCRDDYLTPPPPCLPHVFVIPLSRPPSSVIVLNPIHPWPSHLCSCIFFGLLCSRSPVCICYLVQVHGQMWMLVAIVAPILIHCSPSFNLIMISTSVLVPTLYRLAFTVDLCYLEWPKSRGGTGIMVCTSIHSPSNPPFSGYWSNRLWDGPARLGDVASSSFVQHGFAQQ